MPNWGLDSSMWSRSPHMTADMIKIHRTQHAHPKLEGCVVAVLNVTSSRNTITILIASST